MRTFEQWMTEYGRDHQNPLNQQIHKVCVPLIMLTIIGFLMSIPVPEIFQVPFLNWGTLFVIAILCFYLILNFMMFVGMVVQTIIMCLICEWLAKTGYLLHFCVVVFVICWIGQFYGHKIEGKKPSFLEDMTFLLIGPLWVTRFFYKKIGLNV